MSQTILSKPMKVLNNFRTTSHGWVHYDPSLYEQWDPAINGYENKEMIPTAKRPYGAQEPCWKIFRPNYSYGRGKGPFVASFRYVPLHALVEPDMQKHFMCKQKKVTELQNILDMIESKWPEYLGRRGKAARELHT